MADNRPKSIGRLMPGGARWTKRTRVWIPEIDRDYKFRIDRLKGELNIDERAAADGHRDLPAQDDTTLNEPQLEICNRVFSGILMLNQFLAEELGKALDTARRDAPEKLSLTDFTSRMNHRVNDCFADHEPGLKDLNANKRDRTADLRYFRTVNKLRHAADYKDSLLLVVGIICAMLVVESVLNSFIFAEISEQGMVGGWVIAFIISGINVGCGLGVGFFGWRYLGHKRPIMRIIGAAVTLIGHGFALFWNLLVGHFREVASEAASGGRLEFNIGDLTNRGWQEMQQAGWFNLHSIISWALVALGIGIHLFAAKEGWDDIADRYPDYKRKDVRARESILAYDEAVLEMRTSAREAADEVIEEAEGKAATSAERLSGILNLQDVANEREREVRDSEDQWVNGGTQLLKSYRDTNTLVRAEGTTPRYFGQFPDASDYRMRKFGASPSSEADLDAYVTAAAERMRAINDLRQKAEQIVEKNSAVLDALRDRISALLDRLDERIAAKRDDIARDMEGDQAGMHPPAEEEEEL